MKWILYKYENVSIIGKDAEGHDIQTSVLLNTKLPYSVANEETVMREAYNGEYTIEDDGVEESVKEKIDFEKRLEKIEKTIEKLAKFLKD